MIELGEGADRPVLGVLGVTLDVVRGSSWSQNSMPTSLSLLVFGGLPLLNVLQMG